MYSQTQEPNNNYSSQEQQEQKVNEYGSAEYWQQRYKKTKGQRFDWLQSYQTLKQIIDKYFPNNKDIKILNIGCGNGQIQDQLYDAGYHRIHNNDISKQVIDQMNKVKQQKKQDGMVYEVMDVTCMGYADREFDMVLDKSTIDALLCSENPYINTAKMLGEVERVLKDDGLYLIVSYSESRLEHLEREHIRFTVEMKKMTRVNPQGETLVHYAYICRKNMDKVPLNTQQKQQFYENLKKKEEADYA